MNRPKIVIDTNVLVSAAPKRGSLEEAVVFLSADRQCELLISVDIYAEYENALRRRKLRLAPERVELFLSRMRKEGSFATKQLKPSISPDESDNRFLECAEAGRADFLVTGNKRHFPKIWKGTRVVNARELLELLKFA